MLLYSAHVSGYACVARTAGQAVHRYRPAAVRLCCRMLLGLVCESPVPGRVCESPFPNAIHVCISYHVNSASALLPVPLRTCIGGAFFAETIAERCFASQYQSRGVGVSLG